MALKKKASSERHRQTANGTRDSENRENELAVECQRMSEATTTSQNEERKKEKTKSRRSKSLNIKWAITLKVWKIVNHKMTCSNTLTNTHVRTVNPFC